MRTVSIVLTDRHRLRFWNRVKVGESNECWVWAGGLDRSGYGRFTFQHEGKRSNVAAHRVAYFLDKNEDPGKVPVRSVCGNLICCNPRHLVKANCHKRDPPVGNRSYAGTRSRLHTHPHPDPQPSKKSRTKLTVSDVVEIRLLAQQGETCYALAKIFNLSWPAMKKIIDRRAWRHVP